MQLRDYQTKGSDAIIDDWKESNSTLLVIPTGLGKTVIFADVIRRMQPGRAMVVAHREELIWQARSRIRDVTGLDAGIEMAHLSASEESREPMLGAITGNHPVIVATVQTLISGPAGGTRMGRFNPREFGCLIVDEAHHATAQSYRNVINYFTTHNPDIRILGVTATPDRSDEEALGQIFQSVAMDYEILDAIHDGWLVDIEQMFVPVAGLDFSHIKTTAGDLNQGELASVMEAERTVQGVVQPTLETMFRLPQHELSKRDPQTWGRFLMDLNQTAKRTLVFTVSVRQAELLSSIFNRVIPGMANWVCGTTPKDQRREMLASYDAGKFPLIVNCNCLSEGYDSPGVEVVVQAKPTKSRALYAQQIGRATRPLPGVVDGPPTRDERKAAIAASAKPVCTVLDFVGNSGKHKLMTSADILGGNASEDAISRAISRVMKLGQPAKMARAIDDAEDELAKELEARKQAEEARRSKLVARSNYSTKMINPFNALDISPVKERGWDSGKVLSPKQRGLLQAQGVDPNLPYAQGKQMVVEIIRRFQNQLCSVKQANVLKRYGYETKNMKREQASKLLDALARNNWKKPEPVAA